MSDVARPASTWRTVAFFVAVLGAWIALQRWVLPAMGCRT